MSDWGWQSNPHPRGVVCWWRLLTRKHTATQKIHWFAHAETHCIHLHRQIWSRHVWVQVRIESPVFTRWMFELFIYETTASLWVSICVSLLWMLMLDYTVCLMLTGALLCCYIHRGTASLPASYIFPESWKTFCSGFEFNRFHYFRSFTGFSSFKTASNIQQRRGFFFQFCDDKVHYFPDTGCTWVRLTNFCDFHD